MGLKLFSSCDCEQDKNISVSIPGLPANTKSIQELNDEVRKLRKKLQTQLPNPNPRNFSIRRVEMIGKYLIAKIHYPDCTNFEGMKILVYENLSIEQLSSLTFIDPHFCDGDHPSPIARFTPTEDGWYHAVKLTKALCEDD